ncbi:GIY-YIG nuclease family protein [Nubsella zeaxanthinifaciens]|uniref:GIY-YIG nuclease family protein n=1 Tax=Nubsella zeaxanthinifaciens TaxID=392412 RepID=UPI000DE475D0|nr:GIY-YIG nuclease family protein [Nubsella zeaxanthinifaciens]
MTFYIYILWSEVSDIYYVGYTSDYEKRLLEHNTSIYHTFTSKHRPWLLKAVFSCGDNKSEALRIERFIKRQKSRKLIEKLIAGDDFSGEFAQLVRVPYIRE